MKRKISFQGVLGAYSHMACAAAMPECEPLPTPDFESMIAAVQSGEAEHAMAPIDNSIAGRVADIHHLLPKSGLYIVAEHFQPIEHCVLGVKGAKLSDIKTVTSHIHALPQCRDFIAKNKWEKFVSSDTAVAAALVAEKKDKTLCAIASKMAAELYGLDILAENIADKGSNTTRFVILSPKETRAAADKKVMTSLVFHVKSVPAALYKALGGFAVNGVNLTKLESYSDGTDFSDAAFYAEIEAHPDSDAMKHALNELSHFSHAVKILGVYESHPFRQRKMA
jgi:prephenate dehydratase